MKCYCGKSAQFSTCCEPLIRGKKAAATAEDLMRSRYSAYCTLEMDYIISTTDVQARFEINADANRQWAEQAQFQNLEILKTEENGPKALVEFKATFKQAEETHVHHEVSTFRKTGGTWYFRSARILKPK